MFLIVLFKITLLSLLPFLCYIFPVYQTYQTAFPDPVMPYYYWIQLFSILYIMACVILWIFFSHLLFLWPCAEPESTQSVVLLFKLVKSESRRTLAYMFFPVWYDLLSNFIYPRNLHILCKETKQSIWACRFYFAFLGVCISSNIQRILLAVFRITEGCWGIKVELNCLCVGRFPFPEMFRAYLWPWSQR